MSFNTHDVICFVCFWFHSMSRCCECFHWNYTTEYQNILCRSINHSECMSWFNPSGCAEIINRERNQIWLGRVRHEQTKYIKHRGVWKNLIVNYTKDLSSDIQHRPIYSRTQNISSDPWWSALILIFCWDAWVLST